MPPQKWLEDDLAISFLQENPKRAGTAAHQRYEKYMSARTVGEALRLGAARGDLSNDVKQGFCTVQGSGSAAAAAPASAASAAAGKPPAAKSRGAGQKRSASAVGGEQSAGKRRGVDADGSAGLPSPSRSPAAPLPAADSPASPPSLAAAAAAAPPALDSPEASRAQVPPWPDVPDTPQAQALAAAASAASLPETAASSPGASPTPAVSSSSKPPPVDLSFARFEDRPIKYIKRVSGEAQRILGDSGKADAERGGYAFELLDRDNLGKWRVTLTDLNPDGALAKDLAKLSLPLSIDLEVTLPGNFPMEPPFVRVLYPQLQSGYVFSRGGICFEPLTAKGWAPSMSLPALAIAIKGIIDFGGVRVAGVGDRAKRHIPQYTEEGARRDHASIVAAHRGGEGSTYGGKYKS